MPFLHVETNVIRFLSDLQVHKRISLMIAIITNIWFN